MTTVRRRIRNKLTSFLGCQECSGTTMSPDEYGATSKGVGSLSERSKSCDSICNEREHPDPSHTQVTFSQMQMVRSFGVCLSTSMARKSRQQQRIEGTHAIQQSDSVESGYYTSYSFSNFGGCNKQYNTCSSLCGVEVTWAFSLFRLSCLLLLSLLTQCW